MNIAQEDLNSFLAVAEELRVKGLTQNNQQSSLSKPKQSYSAPKSPPPQRPRPPDRNTLPPPKRPKVSPPPVQTSATADDDDDDDIQEVVPVKSEPHDINSSAVNVFQHHQQAPVPPKVAPAQNQLGGQREEMGAPAAPGSSKKANKSDEKQQQAAKLGKNTCLVCKTTSNRVAANKHGSVQCATCERWFHPPCVNMHDDMYALLVKTQEAGLQNIWACVSCDSATAKNLDNT